MKGKLLICFPQILKALKRQKYKSSLQHVMKQLQASEGIPGIT